jgi:hypothetical protein
MPNANIDLKNIMLKQRVAMKIKSKSSRGYHFAGVGKVIPLIKGTVCKLTLDEKDAGGLLGDKNKTNHE